MSEKPGLGARILNALRGGSSAHAEFGPMDTPRAVAAPATTAVTEISAPVVLQAEPVVSVSPEVAAAPVATPPPIPEGLPVLTPPVVEPLPAPAEAAEANDPLKPVTELAAYLATLKEAIAAVHAGQSLDAKTRQAALKAAALANVGMRGLHPSIRQVILDSRAVSAAKPDFTLMEFQAEMVRVAQGLLQLPAEQSAQAEGKSNG